jgi:hypothetical protein
MAKGDRKSNREVRKPKQETTKKPAGGPAGYMANDIRKPFTLNTTKKK